MGKRKGIMLCYPYDERRLRRWSTDSVYVQPKLDGERCIATVGPLNEVTLYSSTRQVIHTAPHINSAIEDLHLPEGVALDGEIYVHGWPRELIRSILSGNPETKSLAHLLQLYCFDLKIGLATFAEREELLKSIISKNKSRALFYVESYKEKAEPDEIAQMLDIALT